MGRIDCLTVRAEAPVRPLLETALRWVSTSALEGRRCWEISCGVGSSRFPNMFGDVGGMSLLCVEMERSCKCWDTPQSPDYASKYKTNQEKRQLMRTDRVSRTLPLRSSVSSYIARPLAAILEHIIPHLQTFMKLLTYPNTTRKPHDGVLPSFGLAVRPLDQATWSWLQIKLHDTLAANPGPGFTIASSSAKATSGRTHTYKARG